MTAADSLHAVAAAAGLAERARAVEFLASWHEFYLLAGTAAVTLVGLLFVSLSFNLDVLLHESKAHVLAHARSTLLNFTYVLVVSLGFLIPHWTPQMLAMLITLTSAVVGTRHVLSSRSPTDASANAFERGMRRRGRIYTICYALAFANGIAMFLTGVPELVVNMIGIICALLGNSMGISWDLLVEVGKLKAERVREEATRK